MGEFIFKRILLIVVNINLIFVLVLLMPEKYLYKYRATRKKHLSLQNNPDVNSKTELSKFYQMLIFPNIYINKHEKKII